MQGYPKRDTL